MGSGEEGPAFLDATITVNRRTPSRIGIMTSLPATPGSAPGCCARTGVERTTTAIGTRKRRITYDALVRPRRQPVGVCRLTLCPNRRAPASSYRRSPGGLEVFLVHPGGPLWAKKD